MDPSTILLILLVGAAVIGWLGGARDGRALEAFGLGFIGYRSYGWPRGVQEEDSVHFAFDERCDPMTDQGRPSGDAEVEIVELDGSPPGVTLRRLH